MARSRATDSQALVKAAAEVFESKGYHNATIDDIAAAAGVSRPTVYKYTVSKQALLDSMVDLVCVEHAAQLREATAGDLPAVVRLRQVVAKHVENATRMRSFYAIVFSEQAELSERAQGRFHDFSQWVAKDFEKLLAECLTERAADGPAVDAWLASNLVLSMLTTLYRWYNPNGRVTPDDLCDQVLLLLGGLLPAPPAAGDLPGPLPLPAAGQPRGHEDSSPPPPARAKAKRSAAVPGTPQSRRVKPRDAGPTKLDGLHTSPV